MTKLTKAEKKLTKAEQRKLIKRNKLRDAELARLVDAALARLVVADFEVGQRNLRRCDLAQCNAN